MRSDGGWIGSVVLLVALAALVLRPWEGGSGATAGRRAADGARDPGGRRRHDRSERSTAHAEDVRYIGVDTPETVKPDTPVQCFGPRASAFDHHLVEGRTVRLVFGVERRDVYGRLLAYVYLGGRFVNAMLVRRGLARSLTIPPNDRFAPLFRRLELRAARAGTGPLGRLGPEP